MIRAALLGILILAGGCAKKAPAPVALPGMMLTAEWMHAQHAIMTCVPYGAKFYWPRSDILDNPERLRWVRYHEEQHLVQVDAHGGCREFLTKYQRDPIFRYQMEREADEVANAKVQSPFGLKWP